MEVYARVRRAVQADGMGVRQAARVFGLSRKTIRKMLQYPAPPGYQRKAPVRRPKLGPWLGIIGQTLEDDESLSRKLRHTARRIYGRLKAEHAFTGGRTAEVRGTGRQGLARVWGPACAPPLTPLPRMLLNPAGRPAIDHEGDA